MLSRSLPSNVAADTASSALASSVSAVDASACLRRVTGGGGERRAPTARLLPTPRPWPARRLAAVLLVAAWLLRSHSGCRCCCCGCCCGRCALALADASERSGEFSIETPSRTQSIEERRCERSPSASSTPIFSSSPSSISVSSAGCISVSETSSSFASAAASSSSHGQTLAIATIRSARITSVSGTSSERTLVPCSSAPCLRALWSTASIVWTVSSSNNERP